MSTEFERTPSDEQAKLAISQEIGRISFYQDTDQDSLAEMLIQLGEIKKEIDMEYQFTLIAENIPLEEALAD